MIHVYGIPNCDTVRKARKWLDRAGREYSFHDYKKEGADAAMLRRWCAVKGWERILNKRGTTFRKLPEGDRTDLDEEKAIALMVAHPSLIKRPVVEHGDGLLVGFAESDWQDAVG